MEKLTQNKDSLTIEEFITIFTTILDIKVIRDKTVSEEREVEINDKDFGEFQTFVKMYIHLKARGKAREDQKDIFSLGVASLNKEYTKKLTEGLENKLSKNYKMASTKIKHKIINKIVKYTEGVDITDIENYINIKEITDIIKQ